MGIRQKINENPAMGAVAAVVVIVLAAGIIIWQSTGGPVTANPNTTYYTVDDGQTWFPAHVSNVPPFDHNGQQAVRAFVYRCGRDKPFVNHLERYREGARKVLAEAHAAPAGTPVNVGAVQGASISGREIKRPGDERWIRGTDGRAAAEITKVNCPEGVEAIPVHP
jgi:hypothetical protein